MPSPARPEGSSLTLTIPVKGSVCNNMRRPLVHPTTPRHGSDHQDIDWDEVSTLNRLRPLVAEDDIRASARSETAGPHHQRPRRPGCTDRARTRHLISEGALALIDSAIAALPARTR